MDEKEILKRANELNRLSAEQLWKDLKEERELSDALGQCLDRIYRHYGDVTGVKECLEAWQKARGK